MKITIFQLLAIHQNLKALTMVLILKKDYLVAILAYYYVYFVFR